MHKSFMDETMNKKLIVLAIALLGTQSSLMAPPKTGDIITRGGTLYTVRYHIYIRNTQFVLAEDTTNPGRYSLFQLTVRNPATSPPHKAS